MINGNVQRYFAANFAETRLDRKEVLTVSSRGACRTPWWRRRFSSAFCARPFCALHLQEPASRSPAIPLPAHLLLTYCPSSAAATTPDHFAPRERPSTTTTMWRTSHSTHVAIGIARLIHLPPLRARTEKKKRTRTIIISSDSQPIFPSCGARVNI